MHGFFPTSVFLDSTCFSPPSPALHQVYHDPRFMAAQQPPAHRPIHPDQLYNLNNIEPPLTRPSRQERLLLASAAPNYVHGLSHQSALNPTDMPQGTLEIKKTVLAPFHAARMMSRMYSNHFPGCQVHGNRVNDLLRKELRTRVIDTTPDFILQIFPEARKPFIIDENFYNTLSQTCLDIHGNPCPPLWDKRNHTLTGPASYSEAHLVDWLNLLSEVMGKARGTHSTRKWSHRSKNTPLVGSNISRKPDLILINKSYDARLRSTYDLDTDWCFIKAFAEVTSQKRTPDRMIDAINTKSYLMFQCQVNRRFVVALSFVGSGKFTLTLADREGQLRWAEIPLFENRKHLDIFFHVFSFLMFGDESDIGLDPNFEFDGFGKLLAITVDKKRFVVERLVYELSCVVGRATRVWVVKCDRKHYVLKDSWIQEYYVDSEISILKKMTQSELTTSHDRIKDSIPQFICGGDITLDCGIRDCTGYYRKDLGGWPESQRVHRRIVSSPIGEPITTFRSKKEFLQAIISILEAHRYLYNELGILHRDISLNNILLRRVPDTDEAVGLLIDFDYAELLLMEGSSPENALDSSPENALDSSPENALDDTHAVAPDSEESYQSHVKPFRTGTPPFMAIEALTTEDENFTHHPRHDLESILYVIFYICTFTKGPGIPRTTAEVTDALPLRKWFSHDDPKEIGLRKLAHMSTPELMITNHFTNYWADFAPFAEQLASVCFPGKTCLPNQLTHKKMLQILCTAHAQVEEKSDQGLDGRKRQHQDDHRVPTKRGRRIVERVE